MSATPTGEMMDSSIEKIRDSWRISHVNIQASVDMWDSMAKRFGRHKPATFEDNRFLQLLKSQDMLGENVRALDVGCGTGKYAFAISPEVAEVEAIDLSENMLDLARAKQDGGQGENIVFSQVNWHELDLDEVGWRNQFDLVFAHMTPAVQSAATFEKLGEASRKWCVYTRAVRRTDSVSDEIKKMLGMQGGTESAEDEMLDAFNLLWLQGYYPMLSYEKRQWESKQTLEEALGTYMNRMSSYRTLTADEEAMVTDYLESLLDDGQIHEEVDSTIATIYWNVQDKQ